MEDFVVETKGQCFLCLNEIAPADPSIKMEPELLESEAVTSSTYHSIWYLSRYLGMNNWREGIIPSNNKLVATGERWRLKVELCEECAGLNEGLSKQCQQLEKIELGVVSSLEQVRKKLLITDVTGRRVQQFRDDDGQVDETETATSVGEVRGKCQIAEKLRLEALEKCSQKLNLGSPRVKLQKLTLNQLDEERLKITANPIGQSCRRTTSVPGKNEEEGNENPDVAVYASFEPPPLSPIFSVAESDSKQECELRHPEDGELSTPIIMAHIKDEGESHPKSGNSYETEASYRSQMIGKSTLEVNPQKRTNFNIDAHALAIPGPIKVFGGGSAEKFRRSVDPKTGKHLCRSCPEQFSSYKNVWTHYQTVHLKVRYKCTVCGKSFALPAVYRVHYQNFHMHVRFKCQRCSKTFNYKHSLSAHHRSAHLGLRFKCKFCPATFAQAGDRNRHMKRNHSILDNEKKGNESSNDVMEATSKPLPLPLSPGLNLNNQEICELSYPEDIELSTPIIMAQSHPESGNSSEASHKTLKIRKSSQERNPKTTMKLAIGVYSVTIPVPIEVGGVAAGEFRSRVDPKTGKISCGSCAKQFAHHSGVWRHHHIEHLKVRYRCTLCGKGFVQPQNYKDHYQSVHMNVRFECQHCNKIFTQKRSLSVHQRSVHLGVSFK